MKSKHNKYITSFLGRSSSLSAAIRTLTIPDLSTISWILRPILPIILAERLKNQKILKITIKAASLK